MKFWLLWGFDALATLVLVYFFLLGLEDGSVSSYNMTIWLVLLAIPGAILGLGYFLRSKGHGILAACLLAVPALPALFYLLFLIVVVIAHPRWN